MKCKFSAGRSNSQIQTETKIKPTDFDKRISTKWSPVKTVRKAKKSLTIRQ